MTQVTISYQGDLHCLATHKDSGAQLPTDAPVDNQGRGGSFSPTDLVGTALGSCMATIMGIAAKRHDIALEGVEVIVHKSMSTDMPRRIARLEVDYHIPLPANHPKRNLLEAAAMSCPVHHSLHPDIEKIINFHWQ